MNLHFKQVCPHFYNKPVNSHCLKEEASWLCNHQVMDNDFIKNGREMEKERIQIISSQSEQYQSNKFPENKTVEQDVCGSAQSRDTKL
ncbi:MAG TPA: hypothetical protein VLI68_02305 [Hanamia sp.]|nr:hypothetical protein [Hanamia sp.]